MQYCLKRNAATDGFTKHIDFNLKCNFQSSRILLNTYMILKYFDRLIATRAKPITCNPFKLEAIP